MLSLQKHVCAARWLGWRLLLAAGALCFACDKAQPPTGSPTATAVTVAGEHPLPDRDPALAKRLIAQGGLLLDVRSDGEWQSGHLNGAAHLPVDELAGRLTELETLTSGDKTKPIVTYCQAGGRAGRAKKLLLEAGYENVTNLGGMSDWPDHD